MFRDFFSQDHVKKWLQIQAKNIAYTVFILLAMSLWSVRTGLFELSKQTDVSYQNVVTVVELQDTLLTRLLSVKKPSSTINWTEIEMLTERLKYTHDSDSFSALFTELQHTIILLSDTFNVETQDSPFFKLSALLSDSQKHLSISIQHYLAINRLYEAQKQRFPHRYFDRFYELPDYPNLSLPNGFEHIQVISTLKAPEHDT